MDDKFVVSLFDAAHGDQQKNQGNAADGRDAHDEADVESGFHHRSPMHIHLRFLYQWQVD